MLGLLLNAIPLQQAAGVLLVAYSTCYGLVEATGMPRPAPPGSRWQVPQSFVSVGSARRHILVWGAILGPGFATRNPYAGFVMLPLAVAAAGEIRAGVAIAAAVGCAHGTGRAVALLRDVRTVAAADYAQSVIRSMYSRVVDGYALLVIAGAAGVMCASVL